MAEPLQEAQDTLVKLFKDIYFKAGSPLSYKDELQVRSTVSTLVTAITKEVLSKMPKPEPQPAPAAPKPESGGGDPFPAKNAAQAPTPVEKTGFFSGLVKSKVVPSPHKKK